MADERNTLYVEVLSATNLIAADFGGTSDPYVKLRLNGGKWEKTKIKKKCLEATFNERFAFTNVAELVSQNVLDIEVYDYDLIGSDDPLGNYSLNLADNKLTSKMFPEYQQTVTIDLKLRGVKHGRVSLALTPFFGRQLTSQEEKERQVNSMWSRAAGRSSKAQRMISVRFPPELSSVAKSDDAIIELTGNNCCLKVHETDDTATNDVELEAIRKDKVAGMKSLGRPVPTEKRVWEEKGRTGISFTHVQSFTGELVRCETCLLFTANKIVIVITYQSDHPHLGKAHSLDAEFEAFEQHELCVQRILLWMFRTMEISS